MAMVLVGSREDGGGAIVGEIEGCGERKGRGLCRVGSTGAI